jgi:hypothetical protein
VYWAADQVQSEGPAAQVLLLLLMLMLLLLMVQNMC